MSDKPTAMPNDALYPRCVLQRPSATVYSAFTQPVAYLHCTSGSERDPWTVFMGARLKTLNTFINSASMTSHATLRVLDVEVSSVKRLVSYVRARRKVLSFVSGFSSNDLARTFLHVSQAAEMKVGSARDALIPKYVVLPHLSLRFD